MSAVCRASRRLWLLLRGVQDLHPSVFIGIPVAFSGIFLHYAAI